MRERRLGILTPESPSLFGTLNIYTMETGDGRDIELAIVDDYICWRRVNDTKWIQLIPLSELEGDSGVYVGEDTPPDGTKVWIDPSGDISGEYKADDAIEALAECGVITPAYQDGTFYTDADGAIYTL